LRKRFMYNYYLTTNEQTKLPQYTGTTGNM